MPWYSLKDQHNKEEYLYSPSENELVFSQIKNRKWHVSVKEWKPKKLDYKALLIFYEEIQSALHSGLQLNQAISHLAQSSTHAKIANISKALYGELSKGALFNESLSKLTLPAAAPYCQLINSQGTREDCEESLAVSILQLKTLLGWSQRLLKSIAYPFSIIQVALIILIINNALQTKSPTEQIFTLASDLMLYVFCSGLQLLIIQSLYKGNAMYWLERFSGDFRLTKLFSLLSTTRKTGLSLQDALKSMPEYFKYEPIRMEILTVFYKLRLGQNYTSSFPAHWFPKESAIALHSAEQDGDIERALTLASAAHEKHWQKSVSLLEKIIPALCLFVAGGFVASALVALYTPLLEAP
ncbi:type II secretion system F family protein [Marinomonas sp. 2405UD66-6]|uniref:type II secretion system F family protein n=1 Tax=Marinomonas sp. 2405UD66-6 TaxID=3391834 RepID=UPI0039C8E78B